MNFDPQKAIKSRLILLVGDEEVRRRRALAAILETTGAGEDDFDLETTDPDSTQPSDWFASASTSPFLSERRIVVVRHLYRCDPERIKGTDFAKLPESALIVLVGDEESGSEDRIQRLKTTVRKGWEKVVTGAKGQVCAFEPDAAWTREEIKRLAQQSGKSVSDRAVDTLVEMVGGSLGRSQDELEKLILYTGNAAGITESDVRNLVIPSREWNVFKMVDAILAGAVPEALRQLQILVGSAAKAEDAAISRILPNVSRQLRLLWQARICVESKCSPGNATPQILAQFPEKPNLAKEPPYRQSSVMQTAKRVSFSQLQRCFGIVSDTDARLKGALDAFSGIDTLERMVLDLAEAVKR